MGPPLGRQAEDRDGLVVDYFHGTAWLAAAAGELDAVQALTGEDPVDPLTLRQVKQDLVPFYCPDCQLTYCSKDWNTFVLVDEGFYEGTMGRCPNGHEHMVDDLQVPQSGAGGKPGDSAVQSSVRHRPHRDRPP
jgi:hypothetical protein